MKRKIVIFLLTAAISCFVFAGCGDDKNANITKPSIDTSTLATSVQTTEAMLDIDELTYPQYNALSPEEQQAVVNSFDTVEDFFDWYDDKKQFYEEFQDKVNGSVDTEPTTDLNDSNTTETTVPEDSKTETGEVTAENDQTVTEATNNTEADSDSNTMTFVEYNNLSGAEQKKVINSFSSIEAFLNWYNAIKQEYMDSLPKIDGTTSIDLGE